MSAAKHKKKRGPSGPRRHRMSREARLNSARNTDWVRKYTGKNIVKGYRKRFGVDALCAILELRQLGMRMGQAREDQVRRSIEGSAQARRLKKAAKEAATREAEDFPPESDATFAYIADYTPNGVPIGITWGELEADPLWADDDDLDP